jgi:hypothetical protein
MKTIGAILLLVMAVAEATYSQNVNWRSLREDQQNVVQLNFGYDYGVTAQLSYSRSLVIIKPVLLGLDYSFPMGKDLLDDFRIRLGGQVEIVDMGGFSATLKIMSNFRRYENDMVRVVSFGSDFAVVAGYYRPSWYAAGELGFDKSVTSYLKHSDIMRTYVFPGIKDGWYIPSGGNYYYGIQAGKTLGESLDLSLRLGATSAEDNDEDAVLPYYLQLGLGVRF